MNILVTGGAGYIGSILVPHLMAEGHRVTVVDTLIFRQAPLLECCIDPAFGFVHGDCRDEALMRPLIAKADAILPLAAIVGAPACSRDEVAAVTTNYDAVALLNRLRSPEQKVLIPITNSGYGIGEHGVMCTEESPLRPISLYGRTKVDAERLLLGEGEAICSGLRRYSAPLPGCGWISW